MYEVPRTPVRYKFFSENNQAKSLDGQFYVCPNLHELTQECMKKEFRNVLRNNDWSVGQPIWAIPDDKGFKINYYQKDEGGLSTEEIIKFEDLSSDDMKLRNNENNIKAEIIYWTDEEKRLNKMIENVARSNMINFKSNEELSERAKCIEELSEQRNRANKEACEYRMKLKDIEDNRDLLR